jgi:hypothetical protein
LSESQAGGVVEHAPDAHQASATASDSHALEPTSRSARLSAADIRTVLELHDGGYTQVEIAKVVQCSQATVSNTLRAFSDDSKQVARQMRALTQESIGDWRKARRIAAKRGDHRPARELIEMAYPELKPQSTNAGNYGGVTVIVATPGGSNPLPDISVAKVSFRPSLSPVTDGESPAVSD